MVWSQNAPFYLLGSLLFGAGGYLLYRNDLLGPAILLWSTSACFFVVSTPRGR